ncbi:MAG: hypothetical protein JNL06_09595 [Alphaproteobacteria bacterium]|nr:hypothetical protein [Alphaproteobacteria bacterium]
MAFDHQPDPFPFPEFEPLWMQAVLLDAAWPVALTLVPIAMTLMLARHAAALRRFHTAYLTHAQHLTLLDRHRIVRWLTNAATGLALVVGGLVVQIGILGAH